MLLTGVGADSDLGFEYVIRRVKYHLIFNLGILQKDYVAIVDSSLSTPAPLQRTRLPILPTPYLY